MQVQNVKNYFYEKKIDGYQGGYPVSRHTEYLAGHPVSVWPSGKITTSIWEFPNWLIVFVWF